VPPLLFRQPVPENWFFVIVIPEAEPGFSGASEQNAFLQLPVAPARLVEKISWVLLMKMLPALIEKDIAGFGQALTSIQNMVGDCFAPVQGGRFAAPLLEQTVGFLLDRGAAGAGQSSWGPAVYGLVEGRERAQTLAREVRYYVKRFGDGKVLCVRARNRGAAVREIKG
jgi:beta-RFAP synthase